MSIDIPADVPDLEPSADGPEVDRLIERGMLMQAGVFLPDNAVIQAAKDPELARVLEFDGYLPGSRSNASWNIQQQEPSSYERLIAAE